MSKKWKPMEQRHCDIFITYAFLCNWSLTITTTHIVKILDCFHDIFYKLREIIFSISLLHLELVSRFFFFFFAKENFAFLHTVWQKVVISFFTNCVSCNDFSCLLRKAVAKGQMCEDWFPVIENLDLKSATLGPSINQNVVNQNCFLKVKLKRS